MKDLHVTKMLYRFTNKSGQQEYYTSMGGWIRERLKFQRADWATDLPYVNVHSPIDPSRSQRFGKGFLAAQGSSFGGSARFFHG